MDFQWKVKIILDGIEVSANLTNVLRIEAEEGTAKIAEFSLIPHAGPISVTKWIGRGVKIYFIQSNTQHLLFDGVIDEPIYDPLTLITTFTCTDQLQERISALSESEVNAAYLQALTSSFPASLDLNRHNHFELTPWKSKEKADFEFTEDDVLYQSIQVQMASRREIHNIHNISFQYRYQRLKQREISFSYGYPLGFCEQHDRNATLPNVEMIRQAVEGTGWPLKGEIQFEHQRDPGWVQCGDQSFGFLISEKLRRFLVRDAKFTLMKRFAQTVTEHYNLCIKAPQSIAKLGEINVDESAHYEVLADTEEFLKIERYQLHRGGYLDQNGDYCSDVEDRSTLNAEVIKLLDQAKTSILKSHRNNIVTFKTPLHPLIERHHTTKIITANVKAQGKVKHVIHECDFNQGSCISTISIAISRVDNEDVVLDARLELLTKPVHTEDIGRPMIVALPTHLGGRVSSPAYDENWDGYTGNERIEMNAKPYPERFTITIPPIDTAQAPVDNHFNQSFEISIPNELLILSA